MTWSGRIWFPFLDCFFWSAFKQLDSYIFFRLFGWTEISLSRGSVLPWAAASSRPWPYGSTLWVAVVQRAKLISVMSFEQHEDLILLFEEGYVRAHQNASLFSAKATNYPPLPVISLKDSLGSAEILCHSSTFWLNESVSQNVCRVQFSFLWNSHHWTSMMRLLYIHLFLHFMWYCVHV